MSIFINNQNAPIITDSTVTIINGQVKTTHTEDAQVVTDPPEFFRVSERFTEEYIRTLIAVEEREAKTKKAFVQALYKLHNIGCIDLNHFKTDQERADAINPLLKKFHLTHDDFQRGR